jgi:hypothetical protein
MGCSVSKNFRVTGHAAESPFCRLVFVLDAHMADGFAMGVETSCYAASCLLLIYYICSLAMEKGVSLQEA